MTDKLNVKRREFMKTAGAGAAALSIAGLDVASALAAPPKKWDEETDVLVVGYGGAGAITAITAADAGAQVLILEKNPVDRHVCNAALSGAQFIGTHDVEKAFQYIKACIGETVDDEMCRVWAEQTSTNREYMQKLLDDVGEPIKVRYRQGAAFPELPGADSISTWNLGPALGMGGWKLFEVFDKNVKRRKNIRIAFSSPAKKIVQDGRGGEVLGIICERNGREVAVRGRRATVLTCGGYEFNETLKRNSLFGNPRYFYGTESNTGDGLVMAMAVGADLWHMSWTEERIGFANKHAPSFDGLRGTGSGSWMIVDQYGKRFFNEDFNGLSAYLYLCYLDPVKRSWPRLPSYFICDDSVPAHGSGDEGFEAKSAKSEQSCVKKAVDEWRAKRNVSLEEQIARGWVVKADTIPDLVKVINARQCHNPIVEYPSKIKMDPATLRATINTFNEYARKQGSVEFAEERSPVSTPAHAKTRSADVEFGRRLLASIEKPPFYAAEVWPVGPNTQGGPRFDAKGRVVDPYREPIPRLYKCGELGSIYGEAYPTGGGGNIAEFLAFGRVVGLNAAKEKPQK